VEEFEEEVVMTRDSVGDCFHGRSRGGPSLRSVSHRNTKAAVVISGDNRYIKKL